jgi:hypothetical protein
MPGDNQAANQWPSVLALRPAVSTAGETLAGDRRPLLAGPLPAWPLPGSACDPRIQCSQQAPVWRRASTRQHRQGSRRHFGAPSLERG